MSSCKYTYPNVWWFAANFSLKERNLKKVIRFQHLWCQGIRTLNEPPILLCKHGKFKTLQIPKTKPTSRLCLPHFVPRNPMYLSFFVLLSPPILLRKSVDVSEKGVWKFENPPYYIWEELGSLILSGLLYLSVIRISVCNCWFFASLYPGCY